ncbi:MAG TPA: AMP-binding protein [Solirubrobacteraceae bacterium]|jgi:O-succinylbenzoic acid--CoA ligase
MIVEAWLARAAADAPQHSAVECGGETLSYAELFASAQAGAAELAQRGVARDDAVAIALGPGIPFTIALHSCWLVGATAVPLDLRHSKAERQERAQGAAALIDAPLERAAAPRQAPATVVRRVTHDLEAVALTIHTSGTTATPKRVELTFGNLLWSALGSGVALGSDPRERWLSTLPVCHVGGLSILVRSAIAASTAVVHERFETQAALTALMEQEITLVSVVATTLSRLLDAGLKDPPRLRLALAGGGPVPPALLDRAREAGVRVSQTYGLTESCSQASTVPIAALEDSSSVDLGAGRPLFCTRVEIADDGEILLAGPTISTGALAQDGWLHTGDLGRLDERGNLHVTGRKADTIISGGENVSPAEVEAVLEAHPGVIEAAVIGRSDPQWGEAVTAIVVLREGAAPGERELLGHCAASLAPYKVPKRVVIVSEPLPRTSSGKLLRREIA